jgi:hypothetical protein
MLSTMQKSKSFLRDDNECADGIVGKLRSYRDLVVSLNKLTSPTYHERHKTELNEIVGFDFYYHEKLNNEDDLDDKNIMVTKVRTDLTIGDLITKQVDTKVKELI